MDQQTHITVERTAEGMVVRPTGDWVVTRAEAIARSLADQHRSGNGPVSLDLSQLQALDTFGALRLLEHFGGGGGGGPGVSGGSEGQIATLDLVRKNVVARRPSGQRPRESVLARGLSSVDRAGRRIAAEVYGISSLLGESFLGLFGILRRPSLIRSKELFSQLHLCAVEAISVVALVTFLIGVVVAYLFVSQASHYGAATFIAEAVSIGMFREFSPIIVAVIMAGRSGSAFTAQIGTMKMNEEIDAIRALALSPLHVLVLPRLLALVIAMPLLVFIGDLVGLSGGMLIAYNFLGMTPGTFLSRIHGTLCRRSFLIGLIKAPVFALFIATIGCKLGFSVEKNARSVGLNTTASVVQSVVWVIILDALFAVILQRLDI